MGISLFMAIKNYNYMVNTMENKWLLFNRFMDVYGK
jgi:hypothetical protein